MATKKTQRERVPESVVVTVQRTVQVRQYEPVTVTVTETHRPEPGESAKAVRLQVYNQVGASVARFMDHEIARYSENNED